MKARHEGYESEVFSKWKKDECNEVQAGELERVEEALSPNADLLGKINWHAYLHLPIWEKAHYCGEV